MPSRGMPDARTRKIGVYVDGFNLYYGLLKETPHLKWLNVHKMAKMLFPSPSDQVVTVKYFSALVDQQRTGGETLSLQRQKAYWEILKATGVDVIEGRIEFREKQCKAHHCSFTGHRWFNHPVEKMTDVNIALQMVEDTATLGLNGMCIISGDTDLIPAMKKVRALMPGGGFKRVFIPCTDETKCYRRVDEFGTMGWVTRMLPADLVQDCRFKDSVEISGTPFLCPDTWRRPPGQISIVTS